MKKLRSRRGMTMVELLCAVAVLAILVAAIGVAMPATVQSYQDVTVGSEAAMLSSTLTQAITDELRYATNAVVDESGDHKLIAYDSERFGAGFTGIGLGTVSKDDPRKIVFLLHKDAAKKAPLLTSAAYPNRLEVSRLSIQYNTAGKCYTVSLTVKPTSGVQQEVGAEFNVLPLNPPFVPASATP